MKYFLICNKYNESRTINPVYTIKKIKRPKVGEVLEVKHIIISGKMKNKIKLYVRVISFDKNFNNQIKVNLIKDNK